MKTILNWKQNDTSLPCPMEKILVMVLAVLSTDWLLVLACRDLSQSKFWQPSSCVNMQTGYLPSIQKDSNTHMHGLAVYVKEGLPFAQDLSLQNSADTYLCFWLALLHSVSYVSFLHWSPSSSLCNVFDSVSSNIDKILSINPSANVLVFEDFNIHHKDWLTYSGGTDRSGEICYNFSITNDLTRWLTFLLGILTVILTVLLFWIHFILLMLLFVLRWLSLHWKILIMLPSQFPLTFHHIHNSMPHFIVLLMTILVLIGTVFLII